MIDLTVKTLDSLNHVFSLEDDQITVRGFKEYIAESVAVPADSQRLIYCGRVLQDDKKLNDYDVNGKVIHLVQRAPPQPGQRGNDSGQQGQGQGSRQQGWQNSQRSHYRLTRAQMHGNAMYLGAMSLPAEFVESHAGIPQLSNSLSGSRLSRAGCMVDRINEIIDRLDDPNAPPLPPTLPELITEVEPEQDENNDVTRNDGGTRFAEAATAAITAALSAAGARAITLLRGSNYGADTRAETATNDTHQSDAQSQSQPPSQSQTQPTPQSQTQSQSLPRTQSQSQLRAQLQGQLHAQLQAQFQAQSQQQQPQSQQQQQPQSQQQQQPQSQQQQQQQAQAGTEQTGSGSSNTGQNRRAQQQDLPRPPQMATLLQRLLNTQDRLRPYLERYRMLTLVDPSLPPGPGPNTIEENQRIVDGVSRSLHFLAHTCHALSDIIIDMSQPPPRNLRCRPIIVQHSAILQPGIPIQVEAHISLNGRGTNNNNSNDDTTDAGNQQSQQADNAESVNPPRSSTDDSNQEQESDNAAQQSHSERSEQGPFETVFNLPNNVEVLMEVSSESNIDGGSGNEPNLPGESNNGNIRRTGAFPFGMAPPPFMRNFMQAVAGHMVHGGITTTTINTQNPSTTGGGAQSAPASADNSTTNVGQSTQARSNVGTHPTTATQTRSTSRPHVFHHHAHPMGLGMSIGLGFEFDPYLPCNSHHVYHTPTSTPNASMSGGATASQTTRTTQTTAAETQSQAQPTTTSTTTTSGANSNSANTTSTPSAEAGSNNPFVNILQQMLSAGGRPPPNISVNTNAPELAEGLGNIMQMLGSGNIHVGFVNEGNSIGSAFTLADLFESGGLAMDLFTQEPGREENFLVDLSLLVAQNMTLEGLVRLRLGQWEPIARLRRPLQEFLRYTFSNASSVESIQEQATERILSQLRPHLQDLLASEEDASGRSSLRVDTRATLESLIARHTRDILRILFDNGVDDARFGQEILIIVNNLGKQLCTVLRYSVRGGQAGLEAIALRFVDGMLEGVHPVSLRQWMLNGFIVHFRTYSQRVLQPPDSEIVPLLVYKDAVSSQQPSVPSASTRQSAQAQPEDEAMEVETPEQRPTRENAAVPEDREEVLESFAGHDSLPSGWIPIIAHDGMKQRRQLQMQGVTNSGVTTFSDAYLGGLPTKRRKLIEQQKPRLLVSPTPTHSTIAASMERLVKEGVGRAGVEEVEGAAVAVAADPAVRRAFGQAIRDCLNPCRYGTSDFPDPLRFPNATKYFADQERPPK